MDTSLLNAIKIMEELRMGGEIEKYEYSSEDGFTYYFALDEQTDELEKKELGIWDVEREYILDEIEEERKEYQQDLKNEEEYYQDRERGYWEIQGVRC